MTRDRARKKAIRARMAATGEPYSVAARELDGTPPASDAAVRELDAAVREVIARVNATLAAPSARIEYRRETDFGPRPARPRPGPVGRLARLAAGAAWKRIAPGVDVGELREAFFHPVGVGFVEPAAGRYQIDYGAYAQMYIDGELFGGQSGALLRDNNRSRRAEPQNNDPLGLLGLLREVTQARYSGTETLRGTPCRAVAFMAGSAGLTVWLAGSAGLTVWLDDEHVRRIQSEARDLGPRHIGSATQTFELWDFGVPVGSLDWTHLPSFRTPG